MKKYFIYFANTILKSELLKNASILISGTILAQLISILLQPFLRRFFLPESFGLFSVYLSIVGILLAISTFRYDDAIVLPSKDKESANVLALSIFFSIVINSILFIVIALWHDSIASFLNLPKDLSGKVLYLIPLSVFFYGTYQSFNYWLIRKKRYVAVSANKLTRRGAEGVAQVSFAFLRNPKGLVFGDLIGQFTNVIVVVFQSVRNGFSSRDISFTKISYVAKKYSEFPKFNLIPSVMSTCSFLLPPIFINRFYSAEYTGYFDLSKLLLSIPLALIANSISNVLLQRIAEKFQKQQSILSDIKPILLMVISVIVAEVVVIQLYGVTLFKLFFGNQWGFSGEISKLLVWSFALNFLVSSFSCIFISMRKIKLYSLWQTIYFALILSMIFFKGLAFKDFLLIYVLVEVFSYLLLIILMFFLIRKYEVTLRSVLKD